MLVQGEGNKHPARNGKELLLFGFCSVSVGRESFAPSRGQDRTGKRSGTEDPQSKSMCIERSLEKEIPGGGHFRFLCSVTLVFLPCSEPYLWPAQL